MRCSHWLMSQMQVMIPAGVSPGMPFQVNTAAGPMQFVCPQNAQGGMQMMVNVPEEEGPCTLRAVLATDLFTAVGAPVAQRTFSILHFFSPFSRELFFTARRVGRQTQKRPNIITMLGREKDCIFFYLEAQSGKIEKREP